MKRRRHLSDERGQLLIMTALFMTSLLTMTAFSFNAGYMYDKRNRLQAAADAAAMTGAIEVKRNSTVSNGELMTFAKQQVSAHDFDPNAAGFNIQVNHPPASGPYTTSPDFVEAIVSEQTSTFFGGLISWAGLAPRARAVAGSGANPNCIVVFSYVKFTNPAVGSVLTSTDCSITINGEGSPAPANDLYNRATITAKTIGVYHTGSQGCWSGGDCTNVRYGVPPVDDPLCPPTGVCLPELELPSARGLPTPTCTGQYLITATETILLNEVNKYYCGFDIKGSGTPGTIVTFQAGLYYINGPITDSGGAIVGLAGDGVMLYLSGNGTAPNQAVMNFSSSNNVEVNMSAPTAAQSAVFAGILWYQSRNTPLGTVAILGKNSTDLTIYGAMYFPTTVVSMNNGNLPDVTNDCTVVVAWAIEVDKPNMFLNNKCIDFGSSPIRTLALAE